MAALLALVATILTSFLPILNKRLLQDARPALVAWVVWERLCWWCSSPQGYSAHLGQRSQLPSEEPGRGCVPIHVLFSPPSPWQESPRSLASLPLRLASLGM